MVPCPNCSFICATTASRCAGCGGLLNNATYLQNSDDDHTEAYHDDEDSPGFMTKPVMVRPI